MPQLSLPMLDRTSLDNSVLSVVGRCPRLAFYNYRLNRATRSVNYPINFGVSYHKFREILDKLYAEWIVKEGKELDSCSKMIFEAAWSVATKGWQDPPLEHKKGYLDLGRLSKTCEQAFEAWLDEKRRGYYKVIATEVAFELPLPSGRLFTGRLDQILEWNGRLWVRDFKTVGRKDNWKEKYNPDHQFTGYSWAAQQLSDRRVDGTIIDIVYNTKTMGPEFHPTLANRSSNDIAQWLEWVEFESGNWERYCAEDLWPMRTMACGDYGGCFFRECCNLGSWDSIEGWLKERTIHSVWDPMNPEREEGLPE